MGKKLYVGNLTYNVNESDLETLFTQYGSVQSAQVIIDRDTNRSKGFGFVEMGSDAEAQAAIQGLNGHDHDGRNLTVNEAKPREERGRRRWRSGRLRRRWRAVAGAATAGRRRWWIWRRWRRSALLSIGWCRRIKETSQRGSLIDLSPFLMPEQITLIGNRADGCCCRSSSGAIGAGSPSRFKPVHLRRRSPRRSR